MPKTITDKKLKYATSVVKTELEPRIKKLVEEANKHLGKYGIRAGAEVNWFFDELGEPEPKGKSDEK